MRHRNEEISLHGSLGSSWHCVLWQTAAQCFGDRVVGTECRKCTCREETCGVIKKILFHWMTPVLENKSLYGTQTGKKRAQDTQHIASLPPLSPCLPCSLRYHSCSPLKHWPDPPVEDLSPHARSSEGENELCL